MPNLLARALALSLGATALAAPGSATAQGAHGPVTAAAQPPREDRRLRVCGDPDNLPFSNERQEGFENKIAALLARELGDSLEYLWWPHRRGFVRNTIRAQACDVIIGVPKGFDPVSATRPYYRSTYYIVTRRDRNLRVASLDDPVLEQLRVGVNLIGYDYTNTPPAQALALRKVRNVEGYSTFYNEEHRPQDIIDAVVRGDVDVAFVWGPLAGFFASRAPVPLTLTALPDSDAVSHMPFAYDITVGVRRADKDLRAALDAALERRRDDIRKILDEYHVPLLAQP